MHIQRKKCYRWRLQVSCSSARQCIDAIDDAANNLDFLPRSSKGACRCTHPMLVPLPLLLMPPWTAAIDVLCLLLHCCSQSVDGQPSAHAYGTQRCKHTHWHGRATIGGSKGNVTPLCRCFNSALTSSTINRRASSSRSQGRTAQCEACPPTLSQWPVPLQPALCRSSCGKTLWQQMHDRSCWLCKRQLSAMCWTSEQHHNLYTSYTCWQAAV